MMIIPSANAKSGANNVSTIENKIHRFIPGWTEAAEKYSHESIGARNSFCAPCILKAEQQNRLANVKTWELNSAMHKEVIASFRALMLLAVTATSLLGSSCSSMRSPSASQPYWEVPSEAQSSPGVEAFEDILYWTVYWTGSVLAH